MAETTTIRGQDNKRRVFLMLGIGLLLLVPLIAMAFTKEVNWTAYDFLAAIGLLGSAALLYEVMVVRIRKRSTRVIASAGVVALVLAIWAEGAVGILR